jgi:acetyl esterase/lipase
MTVERCAFLVLIDEYTRECLALPVARWLLPGFDSHRIAVAGNSFGGNLTLLAAERDKTVCAAVTFAAAANSWERSPELRERLMSAIHNTNAAVMLRILGEQFESKPTLRPLARLILSVIFLTT